MKARVTTQIVAAMAVALMVAAVGCGDNVNDNNSNDNGGGPRPTRTQTPTVNRTATPGAVATATPGTVATSTPNGTTTQHVTFTANSSAQIQGFDLRVTYPTAKGSFHGSADAVDCTSAAPGFTKNDKDDGNLTLLSASASNITFPITITCTFDATSAITASDIGVTVHEVTEGGNPGNTADLNVTVAVS
jgi:hypothetical protein